MTTIANRAVDCSSNNGDPDHPTLPPPNIAAYAAAGHRHLIRKVTQGTGYHWFYGDVVADQGHDHKLHLGHYHWLEEDQDPDDQAVAFVKAVKPHLGKPATTLWPVPDGDWLMDDCEQTAGVAFPGDATRAGQLTRFHARVRKLLPEFILALYSGTWYAAGRPRLAAAMKGIPLIIAAYQSVVPPNPYGWDYTAWQFTNAARVAGFAAPVDYNVFGIGAGTQHPTQGEQMDEEQVRAIVDGRIIDFGRAALLGEPREKPFTHTLHERLFPGNAGNGLIDRVERLEELAPKPARKAPAKKSAGKK